MKHTNCQFFRRFLQFDLAWPWMTWPRKLMTCLWRVPYEGSVPCKFRFYNPYRSWVLGVNGLILLWWPLTLTLIFKVISDQDHLFYINVYLSYCPAPILKISSDFIHYFQRYCKKIKFGSQFFLAYNAFLMDIDFDHIKLYNSGSSQPIFKNKVSFCSSGLARASERAKIHFFF